MTAGIMNRAGRRLRAGDLAIGVVLRQTRTVDIVKALPATGIDWLFIDMEHGSVGIDTAAQLCVASLAAGVAPIVRVPKDDYGLAGRILDSGALGIIMPHVESGEEAQRMVRELRYPPRGHRGIASGLVHFDFAADDVTQALEMLERETLLIVMLESEAGVEQAERIAAVDGVDCLLVGTNDLALSIGVPGQLDHPRIAEAYEAVQTACLSHRKWLGMGGVGRLDVVERYIRSGARLIVAGNDISFLLTGVRDRTRALRQLGSCVSLEGPPDR